MNLPGSEVYTGLEKGVIDAADYTVFSTNQAQVCTVRTLSKLSWLPSLPMVAVSINKEIWDGLPEDIKTDLEVATDDLAYDLVFKLKARDLDAVEEARADPNIEIIDMAPEERKKFRNIAKEEWANWAKKNELTQKVYDSVVVF